MTRRTYIYYNVEGRSRQRAHVLYINWLEGSCWYEKGVVVVVCVCVWGGGGRSRQRAHVLYINWLEGSCWYEKGVVVVVCVCVCVGGGGGVANVQNLQMLYILIISGQCI